MLTVQQMPKTSYLWNNGSTLNTLLTDSTGMYNITVTDTAIKCMVKDSIYVVVHNLPTVRIDDLKIERFSLEPAALNTLYAVT